jgi:hypothetical protein
LDTNRTTPNIFAAEYLHENDGVLEGKHDDQVGRANQPAEERAPIAHNHA